MKQEGWFGIPSSFGKKVTMVFILSLELARFPVRLLQCDEWPRLK